MADALDLGSSVFDVQVQVLLSAVSGGEIRVLQFEFRIAFLTPF